MINFTQRTKSMLILMACFVLCFCWSLNIYASEDQTNIELDPDALITPLGPVDFVQCVQYMFDELSTNLQICALNTSFNPWCYTSAISEFGFNVPRCVKFLFTDFDREDPPPPPDDDSLDGLDGWCTIIGVCDESPIQKGMCIAFMDNCLAGADTDADREQCAGSGVLICIDLL